MRGYNFVGNDSTKKEIFSHLLKCDGYEFLHGFLKESKQFGAQRRESEAKAVSIALEYLARNAGFSDVTRLTWNMNLLDYRHPITAGIDKLKFQFSVGRIFPDKVSGKGLSVFRFEALDQGGLSFF